MGLKYSVTIILHSECTERRSWKVLAHPSFSDGTCVRDYLHVMDLAKGHVLSLDALEKAEIFKNCGKTGNCRAFNLGHGKGQSVLDMIEAMRKASGYQYKYDIVERR